MSTNGSKRYRKAIACIAREQSRVVERALTMVMDDEDRQRRDVVLIALEEFRQMLKERGVTIAPQEVLTAYGKATGAPIRGMRLPVLLQHAYKRQAARGKVDAREILATAAATIEQSIKEIDK